MAKVAIDASVFQYFMTELFFLSKAHFLCVVGMTIKTTNPPIEFKNTRISYLQKRRSLKTARINLSYTFVKDIKGHEEI